MADNTTINAGSGGDVIATDDIGGAKHQRVKVSVGADGSASDLVPAPGANTGTPSFAHDSLVVTGSGSALNATPIAATDVRAYRSIYLQLDGNGTWNGTVRFEASNDNTTWKDVYLDLVSDANGVLVASTAVGATTTELYAGAVQARYFRVRVSVYTAGTVTATSILTAGAPWSSPQPGTVTVDSELPSAAALADALANPTIPNIGALGFFYNGSTWDRIRGDTTNGLDVDVTRLPGAASSSVTQVASSATNVTLKASNTSRKGIIITNDSTQVLYLKFGATASSTSYTYKLSGGTTFEAPGPIIYTGIVDGIWASANGNAYVTELT